MRTNETSEDAALIVRAVLRLAHALRRSPAPGEITGSALSLLGALHREGTLSAGKLAQIVGLEPQSLTRLLARLEQQGHITRSPDPADRRRQCLCLTPLGAEAFASAIRRRRAWLAERLEGFPAEDRATLRHAADLLLVLSGDQER